MPELQDARLDAQARIETLAKARALPEGHLAEVIREQKRESFDATQRQRRLWEDDWRMYQSEVDWSDKEEWQSQVWVPMPFSAIEQATSIIQRSMLDSPEFYGVEGTGRRDKLLASNLWKPLLGLAFAKAAFVPKFADAAKMALAVGISQYMKWRWHTFSLPTVQDILEDPVTGALIPVYQPRQRGGLAIDTIPPWNVYRDPHGSKPRQQYSGSYIMHEEWVGKDFLARGRTAGVYQNIERVPTGEGGGQMSSGQQSPEAAARRKGQTWRKSRFRELYLGTEWWGDLPDHNGEPFLPDAHLIVVNDVPIYGPADNPLWAVDPQTGRRKWPLIGFAPLQHPLRFEGFGILTAVTPLAILFSNLFNLYMDGLNWSVNPPTEVNLDVLDDWEDLEHFPGRLWLKRGGERAMQPAEFGKMEHQAVMAALQFVHTQFENESFVTAFISGLPGYRSNITKGETQIKTQQSMGMFEGIARNMESGGIAAVELTHDFLLQYLDSFDDDAMVDLLGEANVGLLSAASIPERMEMMAGDFNYTFTGVSAAIQKDTLLGRLLQGSALAAQGIYQGLTNPSQWLSAIVETMGLRDRIEVYEQPMVSMAQMEQMLAAAAAGAYAGSRSPAGGGNGTEPKMPTMNQLEPTPPNPAEMTAEVG